MKRSKQMKIDDVKRVQALIDDRSIKSTRLQALQLAETSLRAYAETLNTTGAKCEGCAHMKYENFHEFRQHLEATSMADKLARWQAAEAKAGDPPVDQWFMECGCPKTGHTDECVKR